MTLPNSYKDREQQKFSESSSGKIAVNMIPLNSGSIIEGISYDYMFIERPDNVTEIYTYRIGGASGQIQAVVKATYTSGSEKYLQSVERTDL
jgi:hypothetical protein